MGKLFGTDGVRGIANKSLDSSLAFKIGQAVSLLLTSEVHNARILIGRDTRISGDMLESALSAGICSAGAEAVSLGVIPTSAVAHLTRELEADAGIVISASHNSAEYNGIKVFNSNGYKLADELEEQIEDMVLNGHAKTLPGGEKVGRRSVYGEALKKYEDFLVSACAADISGLKVALDTANGAAYRIAERVFRRLGCQVRIMGNTPDGVNINELCGSTHPEALQEYVLEAGADIGLAFDGDADRLICVDDKGGIVDGDRMMAVCALDLKERGLLAKNTVVATIMSNMGLTLYLKENGITTVQTGVGDRYVLEEMLRSGYNFGGEQSGHVIFLDHNTTGDGILSGIQMLSALKRKRAPLSRLAYRVHILPQVLVNAKVREDRKKGYEDDRAIKQEIDILEKTMEGRGRVLIRASGTEPLVLVMIEGEDQDFITAQANRIANLIEYRLN